MPSTLPSTFASAAAGNNSDNSSNRQSARTDGSGEWSRRPNGATQTFRRPSTQTQAHNREVSSSTNNVSNTSVPSTPTVGAYVPPHISRQSTIQETRYSRDQLLDLFREQRDADDLETDLAELYCGEADGHMTNGAGVGMGKWARREESKENGVGLDVCWERGGGIMPMGLVDMTDEEKELFTTSVNSPIKPTNPQNNNQREQLNRKPSGLGGNTAFASPGVMRNQTRRNRAPSESYPFPRDSTEAAGNENVEETPGGGLGAGLLRRKTDLKDDIPEQSDEHVEQPAPLASAHSGYGSLKRNPFGPVSAGLNAPSSPWGNASQGVSSPMGAFNGLGGFGSRPAAASTPSRPGYGSIRGESRFRDLMRASVEDEPSLRSKPSLGSFGVSEEGGSRRQTPGLADEGYDRPISRGNTFGSAALGGLHDEDNGTHAESAARGIGGDASPTYTNPYQSPPQQATSLRELADDDGMDVLPGLGGFQKAPGQETHSHGFGDGHDSRQGNFPYDSRTFDRPDAGNRGFPGLGGLGGLPGLGTPGPWSSGLPMTTPGRERPAFGDAFGAHGTPSAFASPSLGSNAFGGSSGFGGLGAVAPGARANKLGSLYSGSTQDQGEVHDHDVLNGLGGNRRDTESPFRSGRGKFDDFFHAVDRPGQSEQHAAGQTCSPASSMQTPLQQPGQPSLGQRVPSIGSSSSNQLPAAQQKTMVMPDRMRWVYKDPQGNTQGPWSGLEMHDWYRAGFFSPELLVKKVEDADYEPLAQLIRRIGNSREPFLVPQIGIPGPPAAQASGSWPAQGAQGQQSAAQPPFAGNFPSFGTTLTAEQQNALERRKQEEQYLMHQQKEHLAYQQNLAKQMQMQNQRQQLSHQQSMQSLHSQPSYGSMTSPNNYNTYPVQGQAGYESFNRAAGGAAGAVGSGMDNLEHIREEDTPGVPDRALQEQHAHAQPSDQGDGANDERVAAMLADRARLAQEQAEQDAFQGQPQQHGNDRLNEFMNLQRETADEEPEQRASKARQVSGQKAGRTGTNDVTGDLPVDKLTLTEQVQKAASAKASPAVAPKSAWGQIETSPPPQSISPLPAPAARRNRANVADALAAESISQSHSPVVETPTSSSLAPWANTVEAQKQPSLREIQEAEARRAAKQAELEQAMRRAQLEKEMLELAKQPVAPAPGLPTSSTWATNEPVSAVPATTASAWAKPAAGKATTTSTSSTKKTLQQIQAEEEALARKKKALAAAAAASASPGAAPAMSAGKRYADLAGKAATPSPAPSGPPGAWTTVGANGKVKTPGPAAAPPAARTVSTSATSAAALAKATPVGAASSKTALVTAQKQAQEEFKKWAVAELRPDLDKSIQVDDFVQNLLSLPSDVELVTEAVHMSSRTMDSRHFAEEFVRRRALADKGKLEAGSFTPSANAEAKSGGGWSEVARKGGSAAAVASAAKEEASAFKIVAKKGKGKK